MATLTVDGTERIDDVIDEIVITKPSSRRATCEFTLGMDVTVDKGDDVSAYDTDGATKLFGGVITERSVDGIGPGQWKTACTCADYLVFADFCYTNASYDEDVAVEDVIGDLVDDHLSAYGITYAGAATGVTLAPFAWDYVRVSDALRSITEKTGLVITISPDKALLLQALGATSAPATITDHGVNRNCFEFAWRDSSANPPPNKIILICGAGQEATSEAWTSDGSTLSYTTDYPASQNKQDPYPNLLIVDDVVQEPISWGDELGAGHWVWDAAAHTLTAPSSSALPASGQIITVAYMKQFPFVYAQASGATPVVEAKQTRPEITTIDEAEDVAAGLLASQGQDAREATATLIDVAGYDIGQSVHVDITSRYAIDADFSITTIRRSICRGYRLYEVDLIESTTMRGDYVDDWRRLTGGGATGDAALAVVAAGAGSGGGSSTSAAASPTAPIYLGGSRTATLEPLDTEAWRPVLNHVDFVALRSFTGRLRATVRSRSSGDSATVRLYDVTAASAAATADAVTSTTETAITPVLATIAIGHTYRLEVQENDVYAIGTLEALS